jgi:hypothetical protein
MPRRKFDGGRKVSFSTEAQFSTVIESVGVRAETMSSLGLPRCTSTVRLGSPARPSRPADYSAPMAELSQKTLDRLRRATAAGESVTYDNYAEWIERARLAVIAVYGTGSEQLTRLDSIRYTVGVYFEGQDPSVHRQAALGGVRDALGVLRALIEDVEEHLAEPSAPGVHTDGMHPWVAETARGLWADGYRQHAVQSAANMIDQRLRLKLGVHQGAGASLVASAFSTKEPTTEQPRLRFERAGPVGSEAWTNAHEGAGAFGRGCMMRIRNLYTHNNGADEQEDLEALASLSLLARWIDEAIVDTAR